MSEPIILQLKFPFKLKDDQIDAVNAWMENNYRGTILYSTGTGKTEISFECARRLVETQKKNRKLDGYNLEIHSNLKIRSTGGQDDASKLIASGKDSKDVKSISSNLSSISYQHNDSKEFNGGNYDISTFNILFLVPRVSLINQTINRLVKYNIPLNKIGGYFGEKKEIREIVISTFHSVIRNPTLIRRANMVIIDEVHLIRDTSLSFKRIFDYLIEDPKKAILGLTATLNQKDSRNKSILAVLPPLKQYPIRDAVEDKRLAKPVIIPIDVRLNDKELKEYEQYSSKIKNISNKFKRYDATSMTLLLKKGGFASGMAKAWFSNVRKRKLLLSYNENKLLTALDIIKNRFPTEKIMVFSETLESIERLKDLLKENNIESKIIDAKVKSKDRSNILDKWGIDFNILLSIHTMELGVDVPQVRIEIILATTSNINQIVQRIGRVLRLSEGKTIALIYIIYVDDTTDNKVLGVINRAINANPSFKDNKPMSEKIFTPDSQITMGDKSMMRRAKNSKVFENDVRINTSRHQRAIDIVESSLDNSLIVEELNDSAKTVRDNPEKINDTDQGLNIKYGSKRIFTVKSKTDESKLYTVDLENNTCTCADFIYRNSICKHIIATKIIAVY